MWENVEFDYIEQSPELNYPIHCLMKTNEGYNTMVFTNNGCNDNHPNAKCVIFPKGKTTWEGFQIPFKDGDVVANQNNIGTWIGIYHRHNCLNQTFSSYCYIGRDGKFYAKYDNNHGYYETRHATEEEKQKLFDAIEANGYKWNPETKTLEKLIVPKFKVGDRIKNKASKWILKVSDIKENEYIVNLDYKALDKNYGYHLAFCNEDDYELVPNKFDITTLKPFESRVLVRTSNHKKWVAAFYSHYDKDSLLHHCVVGGLWYEQCIPYKGNKHLLDTTNDCDEYYKTWE